MIIIIVIYIAVHKHMQIKAVRIWDSGVSVSRTKH